MDFSEIALHGGNSAFIDPRKITNLTCAQVESILEDEKVRLESYIKSNPPTKRWPQIMRLSVVNSALEQNAEWREYAKS